MSAFDEIREAKLRLLAAETEAKEIEAAFGKLKIEELERQQSYERNTPGEDNTFTFAMGIDTSSVQQAIRTLDTWSRRRPEASIRFILNSPGGEVFASFTLHDFIKKLRKRGHHVTIEVLTTAMSGAAAVLQAADDRVLSPNAWVMVHEAQISGIGGNFTQVAEAKENIEKLQNRLLEIMAERSTLSLKQIKNRVRNKDWLLSAEEAVKFGFADRIEN